MQHRTAGLYVGASGNCLLYYTRAEAKGKRAYDERWADPKPGADRGVLKKWCLCSDDIGYEIGIGCT